MATNAAEFAQLSDPALVAEVARLAQRERGATAALIASLMEFDRRRLYLPEGFPSLFAYCTQRLQLSEHAAYHRIEAARAALRFPVILSLIEEGELTLTAVGLLRAHLTDGNHREVLAAARHLGKRAVEELVARLHARPDVRASVRKLPQPRVLAGGEAAVAEAQDHGPAGDVASPAVSQAGETGTRADDERSGSVASGPGMPFQDPTTLTARPAVVRALAPARYQVQITVSAETHAKLRHAQDLLRHVVPNGDPAVIFDRALTLLVQELERKKFAVRKGRAARQAREDGGPSPRTRTRRSSGDSQLRSGGQGGKPTVALSPEVEVGAAGIPSARKPAPRAGRAARNGISRSRPRRIPAEVKREVWARDGGQCAFVGTAGRCGERGFLEYHHDVPFAAGGEATVANISIRCRQHNAHEAERFFGAGIAARSDGSLVGPDRVGRDSTTDLVAPASVPAVRQEPEPISRR